MTKPVRLAVADLQTMTVMELRGRYAETFGETTVSGHKDWLIKRIAWRLQALAEGDLSERARARAVELARDEDVRLTPPRDAAPAPTLSVGPKERLAVTDRHRLPPAGTVLVRPYKGRRVEVLVRDDGFELDGTAYGSLSAVAKAVTGTHVNGFRFFGLTGATTP